MHAPRGRTLVGCDGRLSWLPIQSVSAARADSAGDASVTPFDVLASARPEPRSGRLARMQASSLHAFSCGTGEGGGDSSGERGGAKLGA